MPLCPWPSDPLAEVALASLAQPLRLDAVDAAGRRLDPPGLRAALVDGGTWRLRPALVHLRPLDLLTILIDDPHPVRSNLGLYTDGTRTVVAWQEHEILGDREVYSLDQIVAYGLEEGRAVAYWAMDADRGARYVGLVPECR